MDGCEEWGKEVGRIYRGPRITIWNVRGKKGGEHDTSFNPLPKTCGEKEKKGRSRKTAGGKNGKR